MIETLAEMKINQFLESYDAIDNATMFFGDHSVEWLDAFEIHIEHKEELKRLLILGLSIDL